MQLVNRRMRTVRSVVWEGGGGRCDRRALPDSGTRRQSVSRNRRMASCVSRSSAAKPSRAPLASPS